MITAEDFVGKTIKSITDIEHEEALTITFTDGSVLEVDVEPQISAYDQGNDRMEICQDYGKVVKP